jgi:hypothetical protein
MNKGFSPWQHKPPRPLSLLGDKNEGFEVFFHPTFQVDLENHDKPLI